MATDAPTEEELPTADGYTVNVTLSGNGGSMEAARAIMKAGAAMVRAGGAGVFIDNSALAHGGELWLEMAEDGGADALSFAFVGIVRGRRDIWTVGMHVLGLRDIVVKRADVEKGFDIVEVIRYLIREDKAVGDGHRLADVNGPWFSCCAEDGDPGMVGTPMYNPFGRNRLVELRQIASNNQHGSGDYAVSFAPSGNIQWRCARHLLFSCVLPLAGISVIS